ncbi:MAG TPA: hypothetical protein VGV59_01875 [Pyrinomonadaceae bacterium]|nr:hypothetical protein [Pyrinomonadaceae bacterium]
MKSIVRSHARAFLLRASISVCAAVLLACALNVNAQPVNYGTQQPQQQPAPTGNQQSAPVKVSAGEEKLANKLIAAADASSKLAVAEELLKKYPKTELRPQLIAHLPGEITKVQDASQRIALAQKFMALFPEPTASDYGNAILVNAYINSNRTEEAFRIAAPWLEKNANDAGILYTLTTAGQRQVQATQNGALVPKSRQYGIRAIELIEANQKPASMDEAMWNANKAAWLAQLYQTVGYLALVSGDRVEGLARIQKAITLDPSDPNNYAIVGQLKNDEYMQLAERYKAAPAGAQQDELLKKAYAALDEIIDLYAHAVALSEGKPQLQQMRDTLYKDLESYYRSRHNGSDAGLQDLINKYKLKP